MLKQLLGLGAHLMLLFFVLRATECSREPLPVEGGGELGYHSERQRSYYSVFGKLPLIRPYFYARGQGGSNPLDEQLSLGVDCYSDLVREIAEYLGVGVTYGDEWRGNIGGRGPECGELQLLHAARVVAIAGTLCGQMNAGATLAEVIERLDIAEYAEGE